MQNIKTAPHPSPLSSLPQPPTPRPSPLSSLPQFSILPDSTARSLALPSVRDRKLLK